MQHTCLSWGAVVHAEGRQPHTGQHGVADTCDIRESIVLSTDTDWYLYSRPNSGRTIDTGGGQSVTAPVSQWRRRLKSTPVH
jgi:hypothetical protein